MSDTSSDSDSDGSINGDIDKIDSKDPCDVLKILITTDNHLGFMEKDAERSNDSYVAFEEALEIAKREEVDFILLGGDLFHENKPSRDCLTKCQKLLRKHCFGTKPIEFDILSDENSNFGHTGFPQANFNDPNLNVAIPVMSIHGNHDDPTGEKNLSAMDTLAAAGLVNYFGKSNTTCHQGIDITPILVQKGCTKLCIFGLGAIKDERLHNMFEKGAVQCVRPNEDIDDWFNIFVIHQNRSAHGKKNYIPEGFLPDFLDLVLWGHEHECRIRPEFNELFKFFVTQPGSSVQTSLSESELAPKHVGILKIYKKSFKLEPVPLRSVRQFKMGHIVLSDCSISVTDKNLEAKIEQILAKKVLKLVDECEKERYAYEKQPTKPLIRLKVDNTNFETINESRFAQRFLDKVANPRNILQFHKKSNESKEAVNLDPEAAKLLRMHGNGEQLEYLKVQDLVETYFKKAEDKNKLSALTEKGLGDAIQEYIEKDEKDAIAELINFQIDKLQKHLRSKGNFHNEHELNDEIKRFHQMRIANQSEEDTELKQVFERVKSSNKSNSRMASRVEEDDEDEDGPASKKSISDDEMDELVASSTAKGRGRGKRGAAASTRARGGRGSRGGRGASKISEEVVQSTKKNAKSKDDSDIDIVELDDDDDNFNKKPSASRAKPAASARKTQINYGDDDDNDNYLKPSNSKSKTLTTSSSTRRARIEYDDDDDDDIECLDSKKLKKSNLNTIDDDDDENENKSKITSTFSIFKTKTTAKKKL